LNLRFPSPKALTTANKSF